MKRGRAAVGGRLSTFRIYQIKRGRRRKRGDQKPECCETRLAGGIRGWSERRKNCRGEGMCSVTTRGEKDSSNIRLQTSSSENRLKEKHGGDAGSRKRIPSNSSRPLDGEGGEKRHREAANLHENEAHRGNAQRSGERKEGTRSRKPSAFRNYRGMVAVKKEIRSLSRWTVIPITDCMLPRAVWVKERAIRMAPS